MLFLFHQKVTPERTMVMYTELPRGVLTWVMNKNGHLSITLSYMLIFITSF